MDKNPIPPPLPSLPPMDVVISVPKRPERDNGRGRTKSAKEREGISLAKIPPKKPQNRPATVRDVASPRAGSSSSLVSSDQRPPSPLPARARFSDNFAEEKRKKEKKERENREKERREKEREKEEDGDLEEKLKKMSRLRHQAALEILTSEEHYLSSLLLVRELYLKPFEDSSEETGSKLLMNKQEMNLMFGSLEIIINFSKALYNKLRTSVAPNSEEDGRSILLSSVFTEFAAYLKVYKQYTDNYDSSMGKLNTLVASRPQLKKYLDCTQNKKESKGLSLFDYLIMPVQRVPRYCLLLREVIRNTLEDHEDYQSLQLALEKVQHLAGEINESKRRMEQQVHFIKVQNRLMLTCNWPLVPHRVYEKEWSNVVLGDPFMDSFFCTLILFNDILLICPIVKGVMSLSRSYELRGAGIEEVSFEKIPPGVFLLRSKNPSLPSKASSSSSSSPSSSGLSSRQEQESPSVDVGDTNDVLDFSDSENTLWLNLTDVENRLNSNPKIKTVSGCVPRWLTLGQASPKYSPEIIGAAMVLVIDTEREERFQIGRFWEHRKLGENEAHISSSLLSQIGVFPNAGERIYLSLPGATVIQTFFNSTEEAREATFVVFRRAVDNLSVPVRTTPSGVAEVLGIPYEPPEGVDESNAAVVVVNGSQVPDSTVYSLVDSFLNALIYGSDTGEQVLSVEITVIDAVDDPAGKWPPAIGNTIVLEMEHIPALLNSLLPQNPYLARIVLNQLGVDPDAWNNLTHFPIQEYAQTIVVGYADRYKSYMDSGSDLKGHMVHFTNDITLGLGINYPATLSIPLYRSLDPLQYLRYFFDQMFFGLLVVMGGLSCVMIYALMLSDVDEKTYEFGMLRAIGFKHRSLIILLSLMSLCYAVPGTILGLLAAFLLSIPLQINISQTTLTPLQLGLATAPIVTGVLLGMIVPFVANIIPIRRALGRALRESLDLYHQSSEQINVTFMRMEHLGISAWQAYVSVVMIVSGFIVYYLIPLCFAYLKINFFFGILTGILIAMVVGQGMLATILQPGLERIFLWMILWGEDVKLGPLVVKSLGAHRSRNKKTGIMFLLSLSFVIFTGCNMALQTRQIKDNAAVFLGGDILVFAALEKQSLDDQCLREVLSTEMAKGKESGVLAFTFVPNRLTSQVKGTPWGHHAVHYQTFGAIQDNVFLFLYGVESSYLDATYSQFYSLGDYVEDLHYENDKTSGEPNVVKSLYDKDLKIDYDYDHVLRSLYPDQGPKLLSGKEEEGISYRNWTETYDDPIYALVSASTKDFFQTHIDLPMSLSMGNQETTAIKYIVKPIAMMKKLAGFYFSSYRDATWGSPLIVSMNSYYKLLTDISSVDNLRRQRKGEQEREKEGGEEEEGGEDTNSVVDGEEEGERRRERGGEVRLADDDRVSAPIYYRKLMLTLRRKDKTTINAVMNTLRICLTSDLQRIFDTNEILDGTDVAIDLILLFLYVTAVIQSFICFFLLWFSFQANVKENAWEFGVLRAVGLSSKQVVRVYIYEALVLILTCVLLGAAIGTFTSFTLTLEGGLFTEMPFHFDFPWGLFLSVTATSIVVALLSAYLATFKLKQKQIAIALRGK